MQFVRKITTKDSGILPTDIQLFLQPRDPKSVTVGNTFSNQRISWIACEDKLAFISNINNGVLMKINLRDYITDYCSITCGEEITLPGISSSLLMLGCETNLGGLILFYHPTIRRMVRIVEVDVGVAVVTLLSNGYRNNPLLPELLSCMDGIIAVGGIDGSLILINLQYTILEGDLKSEHHCSSNNAAWPSKICKLQYISRQSDTWHSIKQKMELCRKTHDSLALLLNDSDGELLAPRHGNSYSAVTCLHYGPTVAALFVGFEVGVWQMWSITDFELLFSSKSEVGSGVSVVALSLMEPCDDPRHYLYLWVGHSRSSRPAFLHRNTVGLPNSPPGSPLPNYPPLLPASQEPPFSIIYSLAFHKKTYVDSYGLLYNEFYKCEDIFELEMVNELSNFVSGHILSVNSLICANPFPKYQSSREDDKEILRVWSIIWECEFEETDGRTVYVTLFDLNQWYNKMPGRPDVVPGLSSGVLPIQDTPYLSTWQLPSFNLEDIPLSLWIDPQSLEAIRFLNQLDVHYYPSNISFSCIKVGTTGICQGEGISVVNEFKDKLRSDTAGALARPEAMLQVSISLGLLPNFDDNVSIHSITITPEIARQYLLTTCVENGMVDVILKCARHWYDSACTETNVSLDYLVDFLWDLFGTYTRKIDDLSMCLFDYSGGELNYIDSVKIKLLNQYLKEIKAVFSVLCRDYPTFNKTLLVNHRFVAMDIKSFYVDLMIWFISHKFLPEYPTSSPEDSTFPYNYNKMRSYVNARRSKCPLLIDEMLTHWISGGANEWKKMLGPDSSAYPPPSIQDILRISLIADVEPHIKHFFILYFLQDHLDCLSIEKFNIDPKRIMDSYEACFKIQEGQMRISLSYRDIDTRNFKEGIERLLHKTVKSCNLEVWEHRLIILTLYTHKNYPLAFRYLKGMQPPLGTTDDIKIEISLNVSLGNVSAAYFITQQWKEKRLTLLTHFFQECVNKNKIRFVYSLPMSKFEEKHFLDFLRSSGLKTANDLMLYFYIDRHRYPEAFVLYDKMKQLRQCGGHDENSKKRDLIMKKLEARFDSKLLLLQKSKCEAKTVQPPSGFFEERWKPTSHYLKFDDSNPKRPLLKSSIKELAYITVWQGQKLSKMQSKEELRANNDEMTSTPLIESVKVIDKTELGELGRKRLRVGSESGGLMKKPKLLDRLSDKILNSADPSTPLKSLDYSIIQELVFTPKVKQKTPRRQSPTPGPPSILRVRSDKKEEVSSSCDESASTPRKRLKFTLPDGEENKDTTTLNKRMSLRLDEISEDEESEEVSLDEVKNNASKLDEEGGSPRTLSNQQVVDNSHDDENLNVEEFSENEKLSEISSVKSSQGSSQEDDSERRASLEDRLDQFQSRNHKINSFMYDILSPVKDTNQASGNVSISKENNNSFISSQSGLSEGANIDKSEQDVEQIVEESGHHVQGGWRLENPSAQSITESHFEIMDNNSSASDSMDKVYTSVVGPVRKLSTIFETEGENEEPIVSDHMHSEAAAQDQKDNFGVILRAQGNYQESELGDEKLDQECEYNMQFGHDNYPKNFDSESENNNEESDEEESSHSLTPAQRSQEPADTNKDDSESDVICLDSDSEGDKNKRSDISAPKVYSEHYNREEDSSSKSSFSRDQDEDHSEADEYDEESDDSCEEDIDGEEMFEEEEESNQDPLDLDIEELSDDDAEKSHEEGVESIHSECDVDVTSEHESLSEVPQEVKPAQESVVENDLEVLSNVETSEVKVIPSVNPVDPSLLEKIVSFSKTVSEEQLKGLVDVVKTTIDASITKTASKADNFEESKVMQEETKSLSSCLSESSSPASEKIVDNEPVSSLRESDVVLSIEELESNTKIDNKNETSNVVQDHVAVIFSNHSAMELRESILVCSVNEPQTQQIHISSKELPKIEESSTLARCSGKSIADSTDAERTTEEINAPDNLDESNKEESLKPMQLPHAISSERTKEVIDIKSDYVELISDSSSESEVESHHVDNIVSSTVEKISEISTISENKTVPSKLSSDSPKDPAKQDDKIEEVLAEENIQIVASERFEIKEPSFTEPPPVLVPADMDEDVEKSLVIEHPVVFSLEYQNKGSLLEEKESTIVDISDQHKEESVVWEASTVTSSNQPQVLDELHSQIEEVPLNVVVTNTEFEQIETEQVDNLKVLVKPEVNSFNVNENYPENQQLFDICELSKPELQVLDVDVSASVVGKSIPSDKDNETQSLGVVGLSAETKAADFTSNSDQEVINVIGSQEVDQLKDTAESSLATNITSTDKKKNVSLDTERAGAITHGKEATVVDSTNEHLVTVVAGNQSDNESEQPLSEQMNESVNSDLSYFNTAIIQVSEGEVSEDDNSVSKCDLNQAMFLEDASFVLHTPSSNKKSIKASKPTQPDLSEKSLGLNESVKGKNRHDKVDANIKDEEGGSKINLDTQGLPELGTAEVGREVKPTSKVRKKVEMVDKCIMTDKRRHSSRKSNVVDVKVNILESEKDGANVEIGKAKLVDRSMITDKRGIDFTIMEFEVQTSSKKSRKRSSSLQPESKKSDTQSTSFGSRKSTLSAIQNDDIRNEHRDAKPSESTKNSMSSNKRDPKDENIDSSKSNRIIRKGIRRSLKQNLEEINNDVSKDETLTAKSRNQGVVESNISDKPVRVIKKALRRRSSVIAQEPCLPEIPENKELVIDANQETHQKSHSLRRRSWSSSEPDLASFEHANELKNPRSQSLRKFKCLSNEDLSSMSSESTPRRSTRLSKPTDFFSSPSSMASDHSDLVSRNIKLIGKRLEFEDEPENNSTSMNSGKVIRKSRLSRRSNLEDIVEVSESDVESSYSGDVGGHNLRRRQPTGLWETHSKTDLTLLAMKKSRMAEARRRTCSTSSEPHLTGSDSDNYSDGHTHWLRRSTKADHSESTQDSHSLNQPNFNVVDKEVSQSSTHHGRKSHVSKTPKKQHQANGETTHESEHLSFSPPSVESTSKHELKAHEDILIAKRLGLASSTGKPKVEHDKPAKIRRRTISSSSEPPPVIKHSPVKIPEQSPESLKTRKSSMDPLKNLTGIDFLKACDKVRRKSRSLHEGNKVLCSSSKAERQADIKSPSLVITPHSPQLAALMDDYSENRRLTRHQKHLIEKSFENSPVTPEPAATPKRRRRSSVVAGSEDELTPVRSSKRLQEKVLKKDGTC